MSLLSCQVVIQPPCKEASACLSGWAPRMGLCPVPLGARPKVRPPWAAADLGKCPALDSPCHVCLLKALFPISQDEAGGLPGPCPLLAVSLGPDGCHTLPLLSSLSHLSRPSMFESEGPWVVTLVTKRFPELG